MPSGLHGANEECRGPAFRLRHDVQAVVHPVDKVHVGDARRPVHDRVASGPPEPGVGCPVLLADVGLELHDPAYPPWAFGAAGLPGIADESRPQESGRRLERGPPNERRGVVQRLKE